MKNIVLYGSVSLGLLLVLHTSLSAQKKTIELLPSGHRLDHTETVADTCFVADTANPSVPDPSDPGAFYVNGKELKTMRHRERNKEHGIFIHNQRFFRKKSPEKTGRHRKHQMVGPMIPVRLIIYFTAINP